MESLFSLTFPDPGTSVIGFFGTLLLSSWLFDKLNHQTRDYKIRNTKLFLITLGVNVLRRSYLEWRAGDTQDIGMRAVSAIVFWLTIILADWLTFWLNEAGYHEGGILGYIWIQLKRLWAQGPARIIAGAVIVAFFAVSCALNIPEYTPSPPQLTAGALNATYEAETASTAIAAMTATQEAIGTPTATTEPQTATPTQSPTSSIEEVTATRTIIEVSPLAGPVWPPAGIPKIESGAYIPWEGLNIRKCASLSCAVEPGAGAAAYKELITVARIKDSDDSAWVCLAVEIDQGPGGAELCTRAVLYITADGIQKGYYRVTQ